MNEQRPPSRIAAEALARYDGLMRRQAAVAELISGGHSLWNGTWEEAFGIAPEAIVIDPEATSMKPDGALRLSAPQVTGPIREACQPSRPQRDAAALTRLRAAFQMQLRANARALVAHPGEAGELATRRADAAESGVRGDGALRLGAETGWAADNVDRYVGELGMSMPGIHGVRVREHQAHAHFTAATGILADNVSRATGRHRNSVLTALVLSAPGTEYGAAADLMIGDLRGAVPDQTYDEARQRLQASVREQFGQPHTAGDSSEERRLAAMAAGHVAAGLGRAAHAELCEQYPAAPSSQAELFRSAQAAFGGTQPAPGAKAGHRTPDAPSGRTTRPRGGRRPGSFGRD